MKPTTPGSHQNKSTKLGQPYICQRTKECFDLLIKANLRVFQNHIKQANINIIFPPPSSLTRNPVYYSAKWR